MLFIKEILMQFNNSLNLLVWGFPMMALMMGTGLYLSAGTGFLQFRRFRHIHRNPRHHPVYQGRHLQPYRQED